MGDGVGVRLYGCGPSTATGSPSPHAGQRPPRLVLTQRDAPRPVGHLVVANPPYVEIRRARVRQVETAHAGRRGRGHALGQAHADLLGLEHLEHRALDAVVGAGGVAGGGADSDVLSGDAGWAGCWSVRAEHLRHLVAHYCS